MQPTMPLMHAHLRNLLRPLPRVTHQRHLLRLFPRWGAVELPAVVGDKVLQTIEGTKGLEKVGTEWYEDYACVYTSSTAAGCSQTCCSTLAGSRSRVLACQGVRRRVRPKEEAGMPLLDDLTQRFAVVWPFGYGLAVVQGFACPVVYD